MPDEAQAQAVQAKLDRVWTELFTRYKSTKTAFRRFRRQTSPERRIYVGRCGAW